MSLQEHVQTRSSRAMSHQDALRSSLAIPVTSSSHSAKTALLSGNRGTSSRNSVRVSTLRTLSRDSHSRTSALRGVEKSMHASLMVPGEAEAKTAFDTEDFQYSHGLTTREAEQRLGMYGRNELPDNSIPGWRIFVNLLIQPMALMLWIACVVELIIKNFPDFGVLIFILFANAGLGYYESSKAGDAVAALKKSLMPQACVLRDGAYKNMDAALLVPGDLIKLNAGAAVPADCRLNEGEVEVDQSALTGESIAVKIVFGDKVNNPKMGTTCVKGEAEATVEFTGAKTLMGQTASLLEGKSEKSNMDKILINVTLVLVVLSLALSTIVFIVGLYRQQPLIADLTFTVVLIVASIPLAIEIVCTTTLALGSKQLSKEGAIVSRLSSIEDLAGMNMLCSDKTGTLTTNKMEIQPETPVFMNGETQKSILQAAAMAAKWKEPAKDALDTLVLGAADLESLAAVHQLDFVPFDPITKRTEATVQVNGVTFKVTKGAPHVLINLCEEKAADKQNMLSVQQGLAKRGVRALAVAKTNAEGQWKMMGMLTFLDPPRADSKQTIDEAREFGVPVKMITGDHLLIAQETARVLGLNGNIEGPDDLPLLGENNAIPPTLVEEFGQRIEGAGGFAQVFPQHKYLIVACLRGMKYKVGMTGDGVNDAPALKQADVGIAVSGATDAARAAADIILTEPGLHTIINGIVIAREIFQRINNFISYRIAASLQLLVFFFIAVLGLQPASYQGPIPMQKEDYNWPDTFQMPVLLLMLITLLNDGTLISIGYDNVTASERPSQWRLVELFFTSSVLGVVSCMSSVLLLYWALASWGPDSFVRQLGLNPVNYGEIIMMMYLKISVSDFLTLFSSRTGDDFFWSTKPATVLVVAAGSSLTLSTLIAIFFPDGLIDEGFPITGLARNPILAVAVWIYSIAVWLLQDLCKVFAYKIVAMLTKKEDDY